MTMIIYGYGPSKSPFLKEVRAVKAHSEGCSLILSISITGGQKLLLINSTGQDPVVASVVRTQNLTARMVEAEVAFDAPRPDFWQTEK
jgi:hypothetical protein